MPLFACFGSIDSLATMWGFGMSGNRRRQAWPRSIKVEDLRQLHDGELADSPSGIDNDIEGSDASVLFHLGRFLAFITPRLFGALPWHMGWRWSAGLYQAFTALLALAAAVIHLAPLLPDHLSADLGSDRGPPALCAAAVAIGALLALLACWSFSKSQVLARCDGLIARYARRQGSYAAWKEHCCRDLGSMFLVWLCAVGLQVRNVMVTEDSGHGPDLICRLYVAAFAYSAGLLMALVVYVLHVCQNLLGMVDCFCCHFVEQPDYCDAVRQWNVLQAVLRKACGAIQYTFFALQTTAFATVLLIATDASTLRMRHEFLVPSALVAVGLARIFVRAAAVTDKCARVPIFLNALTVVKSQEIDSAKMYVVDHIEHSQAGFYIFEVRLTSSMALRFFYFSCVAAYFMATKVIAWPEK